MKVRLLGTWNGNDKGKIIDVSDATGTRLISTALAEEVILQSPPVYKRETAAITPPEVREEKPTKKKFFKRGK